MKRAFDFREIARASLRGRWGIAVIAGLIASLLGEGASYGPSVELNFNGNGADIQLTVARQQIYSSAEGFLPELNAVLVGGALYILTVAIVMAAVYLVLGSVVSVGYARFNLDLVDRQKEPQLGSLFAYFSNWKNAVLARLLQSLYVFLWSLLLVIPGIIASYSYAMTSYILAEQPELSPADAISLSRQMMSGNRIRLFCLQLSFIGWDILNYLTLGIGSLWLAPYKACATAAFYREVSATQRRALDY